MLIGLEDDLQHVARYLERIELPAQANIGTRRAIKTRARHFVAHEDHLFRVTSKRLRLVPQIHERRRILKQFHNEIGTLEFRFNVHDDITKILVDIIKERRQRVYAKLR